MPADTPFDVWQLVAMAAALGWASCERDSVRWITVGMEERTSSSVCSLMPP